MTRRWSDEAQRYLDGEGPAPASPEERARADAFLAAARDYAARLREPSASIDQAVMAAVRRAGGRAGRRAWWWWLFEARLHLRPAAALAAAAVLVMVSVGLTTLLGPPAGPPALVGDAAGTVLVRFELDAPDAARVSLAGSFNGWDPGTVGFARNPETGRWTVTVALPPGEHQYLFVVDGERWIPDPAAHAQVEDEFGQINSLLVVGPRGVVRS